MLSVAENELLTRVGPDTAMGAVLRHYWIPACQSAGLVAGGAPVRVQILGEDLVAFRDTAGEVGVLGEHCPHRGASLVLARNTDCTLQCLYHGWRIDKDGRVRETPSEPATSTFADRVRHVSYPARDSGGLVWVYMGPRDAEPEFPRFGWLGLPEEHLYLLQARVECNWLQALEGVVDSAHITHLHLRRERASEDVKEAANPGLTPRYDERGYVTRLSHDGRPSLAVVNTDYGFYYAAIREPIAEPQTRRIVRVSHYLAPFYGIIPVPEGWNQVHAFIPSSDHLTMYFNIRWRTDRPITDVERERFYTVAGLRPGVDMDAEFRKRATGANIWLQDRDEMRHGDRLSGLPGIAVEDMAIVEGMGPVYDRSREHLGASDVAVIRLRRLLLGAVQAVRSGSTPFGAHGVPYERLHGQEFIIGVNEPWQPMLEARLDALTV